MLTHFATLLLPLAQALNTAASKPATNSVNPPFWASPMFLWVLLIPLMILVLFRSGNSQRKQQKQVLNALKKGDRVVTIGGIMGTVVEMRDADVVLKVDETSNTKMRFLRSAIHRVVDEEGKDIQNRKS